MRVSRQHVERITRENGLRGAYLHKGRNRGSSMQDLRHIAALDLLERNFTSTAPNTKWDADPHRRESGVAGKCT